MKQENSSPQSMGKVEVFNFSQEKSPIRVQLINNEPWFVAKDLCLVLEHSNHKVAIQSLDEDEVRKVYLTDNLGRKQENLIVSESGMYALIMRSNKPQAKSFRKWVTSEVLPTIRMKGFYNLRKIDADYLDARDIPYTRMSYNDSEVRVIGIDVRYGTR